MKSLRRFRVKNGCYFVTVVTFQRQPLLHLEYVLFWESWRWSEPLAWIVLPDHYHMVIDVKGQSISDMMHRFKITYSRRFRERSQPGRVWQNRFWDHVIRNREDLNRHIDYIHYNPVKHGLTSSPFDYEYSSIHRFAHDGYYQQDWGTVEPMGLDGEFGDRVRKKNIVGFQDPSGLGTRPTFDPWAK